MEERAGLNQNGHLPRIIVVDDKRENIRHVSGILAEAGYHVIPAVTGEQALRLVGSEDPDLVIVDLLLPDMEGIDVCRKIKERQDTALLPVIIMTAFATLDDKVQSIEAGADGFVTKPVNQYELLARVEHLLHIKSLTDQLISAESIVQSLAVAIEEKDPYTSGHSVRVADYATQLAQAIELDESVQEVIQRSAILHDLGMIGIKIEVIHKPGTLTKEEFAKIKEHPVRAVEILKPLNPRREIVETILHHHEWWNGQGYPYGLAGDQIPLTARVLAIADAFDAMTSIRPHRAAMPPKMALNRIEDGMSRQWDPDLVAVFIGLEMKRAEERPVDTWYQNLLKR